MHPAAHRAPGATAPVTGDAARRGRIPAVTEAAHDPLSDVDKRAAAGFTTTSHPATARIRGAQTVNENIPVQRTGLTGFPPATEPGMCKTTST